MGVELVRLQISVAIVIRKTQFRKPETLKKKKILKTELPQYDTETMGMSSDFWTKALRWSL